MASIAVDLVVFIFESIVVIVAVSAVALAITWKKNEFLAGLFFLLLWSVLNAIDVTLATVLDQPFINASQFGFILLALISFIIGMRPATVFTKLSG
ncbi:MAG: hypothetical protein WC379_04305 [Methanoregula sp.]